MALDGDIPAQVLIAGAIDLAHSARANLLDNAVMAQCPANHGKQPPSLPAILGPTRRQVNAERRVTPEPDAADARLGIYE